jgi:hypothetical protein
MGLATGGAWSGSYHDAEIDGVDVWHSVLTNSESPKKVIVHYHDGSDLTSVQFESYKLNIGDTVPGVSLPAWDFERDLVPENAHYQCDDPSLMYPLSEAMKAGRHSSGGKADFGSSEDKSSSSLSLMNVLGVGVLGVLCALTVTMSMRMAYAIKSSNANRLLPSVLQSKQDHAQQTQMHVQAQPYQQQQQGSGLYKEVDEVGGDISETSNLI